jgi:arylsulfatase A-like enzyme
MNRRRFLKSGGIMAAGALLPSFFSCGQAKKPNVLLICVDDLRPELGCYGKTYMKTPHLDRLAEEGCIFTRHFIQAPSCGPSRYSLLTGLRPRNEAQLNNDYMEKNFYKRPEADLPETFIHHFRRNGYFTVGIGKISHTPDGKVRGKEPARELPHSWDEMLCDTGKWGGGFDAFFAYADGESRASLNHQVPPLECADVPDEGYPDGLNARLAVQKLQEFSRKNKPFFLAVGFFKPHLPFNSPKKYWDLYKREEVSLSPNPGLPYNTSLDLLHQSGEFFNNYRKGKEKGGIGIRISNDYAREIRHAYFAAVSYVDAQIGKVLSALKDPGLDKNTIVVVWGDHGWHLGDHTIWGKHSPFERSTNSPLIIRIPDLKHPGARTDALVETLDIYPTLCDLAELSPPPDLDGKSLKSILDSPDLSGKSAVYSYWYNLISMRTDRYRLIAHKVEGEILYTLFDHQEDPYETRNIAGEKPEIVKKLLPLLINGNKGILSATLFPKFFQ